MNRPKAMISQHELAKSTYGKYLTGFIVSLICTLLSYILVVNHLMSKKWLFAYIIAVLGLIQFITQLTLFLHLGSEAKPRLKLLVFGFMLSVVIILVGGSIWIMQNLNGRMNTPTQINTYLKNQSGGF